MHHAILARRLARTDQKAARARMGVQSSRHQSRGEAKSGRAVASLHPGRLVTAWAEPSAEHRVERFAP